VRRVVALRRLSRSHGALFPSHEQSEDEDVGAGGQGIVIDTALAAGGAHGVAAAAKGSRGGGGGGGGAGEAPKPLTGDELVASLGRVEPSLDAVLREIGLGEDVREKMAAEGITCESLALLSHKQLQELGVSRMGDRVKLMSRAAGNASGGGMAAASSRLSTPSLATPLLPQAPAAAAGDPHVEEDGGGLMDGVGDGDAERGVVSVGWIEKGLVDVFVEHSFHGRYEEGGLHCVIGARSLAFSLALSLAHRPPPARQSSARSPTCQPSSYVCNQPSSHSVVGSRSLARSLSRARMRAFPFALPRARASSPSARPCVRAKRPQTTPAPLQANPTSLAQQANTPLTYALAPQAARSPWPAFPQRF
jgi:hypothetical protein